MNASSLSLTKVLSPRSRRARRQAGGQRGAVLVELAIAVPIMFLIALSVVEAGLGWRAVVQTNDSARAGARAASKGGKSLSSDYDALSAIQASLPSDLRTNLKRVIIYKAVTTGDNPPSSCLSINPPAAGTGPYGNSSCNVYSSYQFNNLGATSSTHFGCSGKWDNNWCPTSRNNDPTSGSTGNMDYVGVYVETVHKNVTKVAFWSDNDISRRVVYRIEPPYSY